LSPRSIPKLIENNSHKHITRLDFRYFIYNT